MNIRQIILAEIQEISTSQDRSLPALTDELPLLDSGLDSLCFAILVSRLEDDLGVDPFSAETEITFPTTIGDLIALYEQAAPVEFDSSDRP